MAQQQPQLPDYVQLEEEPLPDYVQLESEESVAPKVEQQKESFLRRAWNFATTSPFGVTEPTPEEWVNAPTYKQPELLRRAIGYNLTTPLAIGGELLGGIGLLRGIGKLRKSRVASIASKATEIPKPITQATDIVGDLNIRPPRNIELPKERIDFETGEIIPETPVKPMFNPKGQTGMTGSAQIRAAKPKITAEQAAQNLKTTGKMLPPNKPPNKPPTGGIEPDVPPASKEAEGILLKIKDKPQEIHHPIRKAWNISRELMPVDLPFITSAGFRQALPMAGTPQWFKAWYPSIRSYGSKAFAEAHDAMIHSDPLMQRKIVPVLARDGKPLMRKGGSFVFKETPSIIEQAGVRIDNIGSGTEGFRRGITERIPVYGKVIAANNRAYQAYLKDIRLNSFRNFYDAMPNKNDLVALRQIGDAVNTFTGAGPLKFEIPKSVSYFGKERTVPKLLGGFSVNAERHAEGLAEILFAPKLIASRLQMLNPVNYLMASPQVRRMHLMAALRTAGAWTTVAGLGKLAGANVTLDPTSADFGKVRIGSIRLDPGGGFQQFLVLASRLGSNTFTQSYAPGKRIRSYELGKGGPFGQTEGSIIQNFAVNKLHPNIKFFYDAAFATPNRPFSVVDRAIQQAIPMMSVDLIDIAREDPLLLPALAPLASAGMGLQFYESREGNEPIIWPEKWDYVKGRE